MQSHKIVCMSGPTSRALGECGGQAIPRVGDANFGGTPCTIHKEFQISCPLPHGVAGPVCVMAVAWIFKRVIYCRNQSFIRNVLAMVHIFSHITEKTVSKN